MPETKYRVIVEHDYDAAYDDPREWTAGDSDMPVSLIYRGAYLSRSEEECNDTTGAMAAFYRRYELDHDEKDALRFAKRYINAFETGEKIAISHVYGYSKSSWWEIVTVAPKGSTLEPRNETFESWLKGDVYALTLEKSDDNGETWETTYSVGDVYLDDMFTPENAVFDNFGVDNVEIVVK